jgi:hypothetical protein
MFGLGTAASVGVNTTTDDTPSPEQSSTSATASNVGVFGAPVPNAGDLVLCFILYETV